MYKSYLYNQCLVVGFFLSFVVCVKKQTSYVHNLRIVFSVLKKLISFFFSFFLGLVCMCKSHSNLFQDHLWHGHWIFEKARAIILKQLARIEKTMFSVRIMDYF